MERILGRRQPAAQRSERVKVSRKPATRGSKGLGLDSRGTWIASGGHLVRRATTHTAAHLAKLSTHLRKSDISVSTAHLYYDYLTYSNNTPGTTVQYTFKRRNMVYISVLQCSTDSTAVRYSVECVAAQIIAWPLAPPRLHLLPLRTSSRFPITRKWRSSENFEGGSGTLGRWTRPGLIPDPPKGGGLRLAPFPVPG